MAISECLKSFTIPESAGACPDLSDIVWDIASFTGFDATGTASADTVDFSLIGDPGGVQGSIASLHGTVTFTGGPCNCQVQIDVTVDKGGFSYDPSTELNIYQDDVLVLTSFIQNTDSQLVPFSLIAGVNSLVVITITAGSGSAASGTPPNEIAATYVFSSVP